MSDEMRVTDLVTMLANLVVPASKVAKLYDEILTRPGLSVAFRNQATVAHLLSHGSLRISANLLKMEANVAVGMQGDLFDTPVDHAMQLREIEALVDGLKDHVVGDVEAFSLRVAAENKAQEQQGPPGLADAVSLNVYTSASPVSFAELEAHFGDADGVRAALDYLLGAGKIVDTDGLYSPAGGELSSVTGDDLRQLYEAEVGKNAGKKKEEQLRAAILDKRRAAAGA